MSDIPRISSTGQTGRVYPQYPGGGYQIKTGGGGTGAIRLPASGISLSPAARQMQQQNSLAREIWEMIKQLGRDMSIVKEEFGEWIKSKGGSISKLKELSVDKLQSIKNLLVGAKNGAANEVANVLRRIDSKMENAKLVSQQIGILKNHIQDLTGKLGVDKKEIWKIIKDNLGSTKDIYRQIGSGSQGSGSIMKNLDIIGKGLQKGVSSRALAKLDLTQLKVFVEAIKNTISTRAVTAGGLSGTALSIAGRSILIPAASALGAKLTAAIGTASAGITVAGIAFAAAGGWFIGRAVGNIPIGEGKKVDNALQDLMQRTNVVGVSYPKTEWGPTAQKHINEGK